MIEAKKNNNMKTHIEHGIEITEKFISLTKGLKEFLKIFEDSIAESTDNNIKVKYQYIRIWWGNRTAVSGIHNMLVLNKIAKEAYKKEYVSLTNKELKRLNELLRIFSGMIAKEYFPTSITEFNKISELNDEICSMYNKFRVSYSDLCTKTNDSGLIENINQLQFYMDLNGIQYISRLSECFDNLTELLTVEQIQTLKELKNCDKHLTKLADKI